MSMYHHLVSTITNMWPVFHLCLLTLPTHPQQDNLKQIGASRVVFEPETLGGREVMEELEKHEKIWVG